jgi:hypothetical protein
MAAPARAAPVGFCAPAGAPAGATGDEALASRIGSLSMAGLPSCQRSLDCSRPAASAARARRKYVPLASVSSSSMAVRPESVTWVASGRQDVLAVAADLDRARLDARARVGRVDAQARGILRVLRQERHVAGRRDVVIEPVDLTALAGC